MTKLLPCPFCGGQPKTWWDWQPEEGKEYWEGFNIQCCIVHIQSIYMEDAIRRWDTRYNANQPTVEPDTGKRAG